MPYSKNLERYPKPLRDIIDTYAQSEEPLTKTLTPRRTKEAIRYRALFYACRKVKADKMLERGNAAYAEKILSVGMKLTKLPGDMAELQLFNQHGDLDQGFLSELSSEVSPQATTPTSEVPPEELAALTSHFTALAQREEQTSETINNAYSKYLPTSDEPFEKATEEDIEAFRETQRRYASDSGTKHTSHSDSNSKKGDD